MEEVEARPGAAIGVLPARTACVVGLEVLVVLGRGIEVFVPLGFQVFLLGSEADPQRDVRVGTELVLEVEGVIRACAVVVGGIGGGRVVDLPCQPAAVSEGGLVESGAADLVEDREAAIGV
jgi:hypothetical protein